ncbi:uncharacterized protein LOC127256983 [Andrographis paniculata]|uniref:uncharacterized protein LOC127256983 n=1 Tax=Andrographis paniculata TaxID=175694 RepID=UPI0021E8939C|nr:uncharacterized protein LOC127256983 [Andrographis paniculata]
MPKLLMDFLHEKQEPFSMDQYLLERGLIPFMCNNSSKPSKRSSIRRPKSVPNCTEFVKAAVGRVVEIINGDRRNRSCDETCDDRYLSKIGTTLEEEVDEDKKLEESVKCFDKQLSHVYVLDATESGKGSPLYHEQRYIQTTTTMQENSLKFTPKPHHHPKKYYNNIKDLYQEFMMNTDSYSSKYLTNMMVLERTKPLMIDCVREIIESHKKQNKGIYNLKKILDTDELWLFVRKNVWEWSQDPVDETNLVCFLRNDLLASTEESRVNYENIKNETSMEIGAVILEGIVDELVEELCGEI